MEKEKQTFEQNRAAFSRGLGEHPSVWGTYPGSLVGAF